MINTNIKKLELKLAEVINNSGVEMATIALILDKLSKEANMILEQVILKEQQAIENNSNDEQPIGQSEPETVK